MWGFKMVLILLIHSEKESSSFLSQPSRINSTEFMIEIKFCCHLKNGDSLNLGPFYNVNIVRNEELKSLILKGPKFRDLRSFKWQQNFISIMDSFEDYARLWAKSEKKNMIPFQNGLKV
jgi:hypothetical protein